MIKKFDLLLKPMMESDLEKVLEWRNSEHIKRYALQQEQISFEQHKSWFHSVVKKGDEYYVIEKEGADVGLIWAKNINAMCCESGFYLYDTSIQNSLFPYRVAITLNDYLFYEKNLKQIECEILHTNERSIRFSLSLGYKKVEDHQKYSIYRLDKLDYEKNSRKISKQLQSKK